MLQQEQAVCHSNPWWGQRAGKKLSYLSGVEDTAQSLRSLREGHGERGGARGGRGTGREEEHEERGGEQRGRSMGRERARGERGTGREEEHGEGGARGERGTGREEEHGEGGARGERGTGREEGHIEGGRQREIKSICFTHSATPTQVPTMKTGVPAREVMSIGFMPSSLKCRAKPKSASLI